ncbi:MAG: hypothetical protein L3J07_02245 [Candidatus Magasanikbacteria bacterium]|nr:hypothetical protein [Candidatus Magasanikbacteria bacterium]
MINFLGIKNLTNIVKGHNSEDRGLMKLEDIKIKYEAENAIFEESAILININNLYQRNMSEKEIYDATRKSWRIDIKRASKIKIVCSIYKSIIREVFLVDKWVPSIEVKHKYMFNGKVVQKKIRNKYINKSVAKYWGQGMQYPIKYVSV